MNDTEIKETKSYAATVFIAGDLHQAKGALRRFCMEGLCVTVTPTTFIFTGGAEEGVAVGLINYPRFPKSDEVIWETAIRLGMTLMDDLCQWSFSVVATDKTHWFSRRKPGE